MVSNTKWEFSVRSNSVDSMNASKNIRWKGGRSIQHPSGKRRKKKRIMKRNHLHGNDKIGRHMPMLYLLMFEEDPGRNRLDSWSIYGTNQFITSKQKGSRFHLSIFSFQCRKIMLKAEWSIKLLESLLLDSARHGRFTRRIQIWSKADFKQVCF